MMGHFCDFRNEKGFVKYRSLSLAALAGDPANDLLYGSSELVMLEDNYKRRLHDEKVPKSDQGQMERRGLSRRTNPS